MNCYSISRENTRGRKHPIAPAYDRNIFQRDYARIVHSRYFRILQGKHMSLCSNETLGYRTKMSHSVETEQVARSISRQLELNEDLTAAISVGYNIGDVSFGQLGEDIVSQNMKSGSFCPSGQSLRIVEEMESPYLDNKGLNLLFETREGLAMRRFNMARQGRVASVGGFTLSQSPSLEAQVVEQSNVIVKICDDLHELLLVGALDEDSVRSSAILDKVVGALNASRVNSVVQLTRNPSKRLELPCNVCAEIARRVAQMSVSELIASARKEISRVAPNSVDHVRKSPQIIVYGQQFSFDLGQLQEYLAAATKRYCEAQAEGPSKQSKKDALEREIGAIKQAQKDSFEDSAMLTDEACDAYLAAKITALSDLEIMHNKGYSNMLGASRSTPKSGGSHTAKSMSGV